MAQDGAPATCEGLPDSIDAGRDLHNEYLVKETHRESTSTDRSCLAVLLQAAPGVSMENAGAHVHIGDEVVARRRSHSPLPLPRSRAWRSRLKDAWQDNKGVFLMIVAQFFNSAMAAMARLLETGLGDRSPMNPFQILFARQSVTCLFSLFYMWWVNVPEAPLGHRKVRPLLVLRGFSGFFGVLGLYFSLVYLPVADAMVLTFIAPMLAAWINSLIIKTPFTRTQRIAGLISFVGVILIARPFTLFSFSNPTGAISIPDDAALGILNATVTNSRSIPKLQDPTNAERGTAVLFGLLGVCGAAWAFVTISWIGKRAHPLISVNYFAVWCTFVSAIALAFVPGVLFRLPATLREWALLLGLGVTGFLYQFTFTASLSHKSSNLVLNVVYVQMLYALFFDKVVWDESPGLTSLMGSGLILCGVIWVAVKKDGEKAKEREVLRDGDEEVGELLGNMDVGAEEDTPYDAPLGDEESSRESDGGSSAMVVEMQELSR